MIPNAGDIFWADLDPVVGSEQAGRRPVLILTGVTYHLVSSRAIICPITRRQRDWWFEVPLPAGMRTSGYVLGDQIRAVHRDSRLFAYIETAPQALIDEVRGRLASLLGIAFAD